MGCHKDLGEPQGFTTPRLRITVLKGATLSCLLPNFKLIILTTFLPSSEIALPPVSRKKKRKEEKDSLLPFPFPQILLLQFSSLVWAELAKCRQVLACQSGMSMGCLWHESFSLKLPR